MLPWKGRLAIFSIVIDTLVVCTMSILLILVTDVWTMPIDASIMVQTALARSFPWVHLYLPVLFFLLGYTTIISFFAVGTKCALFLFPKNGKLYFSIYAMSAFVIFSFTDPEQAFTFMSLAGGLLLMINATALFLLRKEIRFDLTPQPVRQKVRKRRKELAL